MWQVTSLRNGSIIQCQSDILYEEAQAYKVLTLGPTRRGRRREGGGGRVVDKKTSAPEVFSSNCSFIPRAHFETSLVMVSYYGYEI